MGSSPTPSVGGFMVDKEVLKEQFRQYILEQLQDNYENFLEEFNEESELEEDEYEYLESLSIAGLKREKK